MKMKRPTVGETQRIRVTSNIDDLPVFITSINEGAVRKAVARSIKRTTSSVRVETFKEIRQRQLVDTRRLTAKKLKERGYVRDYSKASASSRLEDMFGLITISDQRPLMMNFFAKRVRKGRSKLTGTPLYGAKAKIMGKTFPLGKAFIARHKTNRAVVLMREGPKPYPLKALFGPSLAYMLNRTQGIIRIQAMANERMAREMESNLEYYLARI